MSEPEVKISIATGYSARTKNWKNSQLTWAKIVDRLSKPVVTTQTRKEFDAASREDQTSIKDVGGYVGGYLVGGKRSPSAVGHRQLITLDVDFGGLNFWQEFKEKYNCAAFIHGTYKHTDAAPRYRLLIPMSRETNAAEYEATARSVAGSLGIDMFDATTFELNRLMFWPAHPAEGVYYSQMQEGAFIDVDQVLSTYVKWKDSTLWPTANKLAREITESVSKQEDPHMKRGLVGAFCRTFTITEVIDKYLRDVYTIEDTGRYTYAGGSTSSGLTLYDDLFVYSHHGTDPAGGKLCNAFDLVRLHLFGHLDIDAKSKKSFSKMEVLCTTDAQVKQTLASERGPAKKRSNSEWQSNLEIDTKGNVLATSANVDLILQNDPSLSGFFYNIFDAKRYVSSSLPWREVEAEEPVRNVDYSGIRNYFDTNYGLNCSAKIDDSFALMVERNAKHPIKIYLDGLEWDGVSRLGQTLQHYFGASDSVFVSQAFIKMLVAGVARVFDPGCKFDYMLVLMGEQGAKKSSFLRILGQGWFSDSFSTVQGKESFEQLQGAWIIEVAELSAFKAQEVQAVKHFISKQKDDFRPAYARSVETFQRQCIFFGTSNETDILKDATGNRRFWPVMCGANTLKDVFTDLAEEVDQLWAEAVHLYHAGEPLYLSKEVEATAREVQRVHSVIDERAGIIGAYLDRLLPENWNSLDFYDRRAWLESTTKGTNTRNYVCTAEVWCECLFKNKEDMTRYATKDINDIMRSMKGWTAVASTRYFGTYGAQKYYKRNLA